METAGFIIMWLLLAFFAFMFISFAVLLVFGRKPKADKTYRKAPLKHMVTSHDVIDDIYESAEATAFMQ